MLICDEELPYFDSLMLMDALGFLVYLCSSALGHVPCRFHFTFDSKFTTTTTYKNHLGKQMPSYLDCLSRSQSGGNPSLNPLC